MRTSARWLVLFVLSFACGAPVVHAETGSSQPDQVTIADVKVRISDHGPVVLLQAEGKTIPDLCRSDGRRVHPGRIEW